MKTAYEVYFPIAGDEVNVIGGAGTRKGALEVAAEAEAEYGEKPLIRRVRLPETRIVTYCTIDCPWGVQVEVPA